MKPVASSIDFQSLYERLDRADARLRVDVELSEVERRTLLGERAKSLAKVQSLQVEPEELLDVLVFQMGPERYAVRLGDVQQVIPLKGVYSVPGAPKHFLGMLAYRSAVLGVVDLRELLKVDSGLSDLGIGLVVTVEEESLVLAVSAVEGRTRLSTRELSQPVKGPFVGVSSDGMILLDLTQLGRVEGGDDGR